MLLNLVSEIGNIQLTPAACIKLRPRVKKIKKVLEGKGAGRSVLGKSLKRLQVFGGGIHLMQVSLHHGKLVVSGSWVVANADKVSKQSLCLSKALARNAEVSQLQKSVRRVRIGAEYFFEIGFRTRRVS